MKFTIVVQSAPAASQSAWSAYRFTRSALDAGHEIYRVFFYGDGVHNSNSNSVAPQDEFDLVAAWNTLLSEHGIDTVSCVSSALKRGVLDAGEAERYERGCANLTSAANLSGLGQLVDATLVSDRVISFGA